MIPLISFRIHICVQNLEYSMYESVCLEYPEQESTRPPPPMKHNEVPRVEQKGRELGLGHVGLGDWEQHWLEVSHASPIFTKLDSQMRCRLVISGELFIESTFP